MMVISNTGPIIAFSKLKRFDILENIYSSIILPEESGILRN